MKVIVNLELHYENETVQQRLRGLLKEDGEDELLFKMEEGNTMHFYLKEQLFVREKEESVFSYHFLKEGSLEIYLKAYQKGTRMPLKTEKYERTPTSLEVIYQIEGNDTTHHLKLEWEEDA